MKRSPNDRSLSEWTLVFRNIYFFTQNAQRDEFRIFTGLVSAAGHFWKRVYRGNSYDDASAWLARVFAWYSALINQLQIEDVDGLIWAKFPGRCPFCVKPRCVCGGTKKPMNRGIVSSIASESQIDRPRTLSDWQKMFNEIYAQGTQNIPSASKRAEDKAQALLLAGNKLAEELGELGEALVIAPFSSLELHDELADVFAWICGAANALPGAFGEEAAFDLGAAIWSQYPDQCDRCETNPCICTLPPIQRILEREGIRDMRGVDGLTGAYIRDRLDVDLGRHAKKGVKRIGLAFFDVDDFKRFNEMPGRWRQGDVVLRTVVERAQTSVGKSARVYKYGGDEFALIAVGAEIDEIKKLIVEMHSDIGREPVPSVTPGNGDAGNVGISLGAAVAGDWEGDVETLLARAQEAAAGVKGTTKGTIAIDEI